ncbi:MAG: PAS domain S-box protein [Pseudomonadota bacterium]
MPFSNHALTTLVVSPPGRDAEAMARMLERGRIIARVCRNLGECSREMAGGAGALLVTEEGLATAGAPDLIASLDEQPSWSTIPIIVLVTGTSSHHSELLNRLGLAVGAVTLLERPVRQSHLISVVKMALSARRRQYEVRGLVEERTRRELELQSQTEALRRSESRLRELADTAPAMLWASNAEHQCRYLSRSWYEFTGMVQAAADDLPWAEPIHPDDAPRVVEAFRAAAARRQAFHLEYRLRSRSGEWHWVTDAGRPRFDGDGRFLGYIGSVTDIHDLHLAEEETERSRALLDAVLESLPVGVAITDADGALMRWNQAHEQLWGLSSNRSSNGVPEPPPIREWTGWWPESGKPVGSGDWPLVRALRRRQSVCGELVEIAPFDGGRRRCVMSAAAPVFDRSGKLIAAVAAYTDVTDSIHAQQALREADRRKDEFIATLAHELRNPLAPIRTAVELLERGGNDPDTLEHCRGVIHRQVQDLTRLVGDMLEVSRIARGKFELHRYPVQLHEVVDHALEVSRPLIDQHGHELVVDAPGRDAWLLADPSRLAQVLTNLLNNAAHYTPAGGRITVTTRVSGERVRIAVRDTGIGIAAEDLPGVFEMYAQVTGGEGGSAGGLGIGLSLAKGLVELHGGSITAHSAGKDQGSEFIIDLPLAEPPAARPARQASSAPVPTAPDDGRKRVLVVDDDREAAEGLGRVLRLMGHRVRVAYDGAEALSVAERDPPEVAVLSTSLSAMAGTELARRFRSARWGRNVALVARRARTAQEPATAADVFDHHLTGPVDAERLARAFSELGRSSVDRRRGTALSSPP